jgi:Mrp family chromosome partitioning ATPase
VAQFVALDTRIEALATQGALYGSGVQLYVAPEVPKVPVQPKPKRNAAIGFVLGLIGAGAFAWWRSETDQRVDDRNAPARILDAPLLGTVPVFERVDATGPAPVVNSPDSAATRAYEFVASSLSFALEQVNGTKVMFTSANTEDGKTVTVLNTSLASAQDGRSVLLVDADERVRGLTKLSGYELDTGLTDLVNGDVTIDEAVKEWSIGDGSVMSLIPGGAALDGDTAAIFRSERFRSVAKQLGVGRSLVVVDAPPALAVAETTDIASQVDGIVVVVTEGTAVRDLVDVRDRLAMSSTPIIGYVFNRSTASSDRNRYGYGEPERSS